MKKGKGNGAVLYVRVSTDEQASGPLNLSNQEKRCRAYCEQNGLAVVEVFTDPGVSGRSAADRPDFQRMLSFCRAHRSDVGYVVVQDLSRFARFSKDQADAIFELGKHGIHVRSEYERNVDETAAGKLAANMLGAFNQYFSDSLSEKMKDRTRASCAAGRFPWRAPIGYINVGGKIGANIKPDPIRAPLIRRAFELIATGRHKKAEVLKTVTDEGLKTASGKPLSPQTFQAVLLNPLYAGWVTLPSDQSFEPVGGLHEPITSQETFDRVQAILVGKKLGREERKTVHPLFPLRNFFRCESCRTPLTGGLAKGRTKKYPRYWCRKKGCRAVKLSSAQLEAEFLEFLRRVRMNPQIVPIFPKVAAKVWAEKQGDSERNLKRLTVRLAERKGLKSELLKAKLRSEVSLEDYQQANAEFTAEIAGIEEQLRAATLEGATLDSFLRFAELQLADIAGTWQMAAPDDRRRVQNLLFQDGLDYSPEAGILNRSNSSLFSMLEALRDEKGLLASPTGFEPVLSP